MLIAMASVVWVPIGVWIGLRPAWAERLQPIAQFLAAFPANVLFPVVAMIASVALEPDPEHLAVAADDPGHPVVHPVQRDRRRQRIPGDMREAPDMFHVKRLAMVAPGRPAGNFPLLYHRRADRVGGSWNASIVAEAGELGQDIGSRHGLGSLYQPRPRRGTCRASRWVSAVMSVFVIAFNRTRMAAALRYAERRLRMN